jgi:hypothetical protein
MNRFLHISFTFNEGLPKVQELVPIFNAIAPDWVRYSYNCWIVWSARPASDFLFALKPAIAQSDSVLIVKLDMSDRTGWQPQWIWEWMDRKRQLGPPQPPAPPPPDLGSLLESLGGTRPWLGGLLEPPPKKK